MSGEAPPPRQEGDPVALHLRRSIRLFGGLAASFFLLGMLGRWLDLVPLIFAALPLLPVLGLFLLIACMMVTVRGFRLAWRQEGPHAQRLPLAAAAPAMLMLTLLLAFPLLSAGRWSAAWTSLLVHRTEYDRIVAELQSRPAAALVDRMERGGTNYRIDPGPPLRVAFEPDGMLDNWSAIVFDPSDALAGSLDAPELAGVFGGELFECSHLAGHYYLCSAT